MIHRFIGFGQLFQVKTSIILANSIVKISSPIRIPITPLGFSKRRTVLMFDFPMFYTYVGKYVHILDTLGIKRTENIDFAQK